MTEVDIIVKNDTQRMSLPKNIVGTAAVAALLIAGTAFAQTMNQPGQPGGINQPGQPGTMNQPGAIGAGTSTGYPPAGTPGTPTPTSMPGATAPMPGVPNTGAGGEATQNALILGLSALVAAGGALFLARRFAHR